MTDKPRARLVQLSIEELSGVDRPCHAPALVALMKRKPDDDDNDSGSGNGGASGAPAIAAEPTPHLKSTHPIEPSKVNIMTTKFVVLTEAQHAHYSKLAGDERDTFVAKSASERDAVVKAAADADPVVYSGEVTKISVRKSDGALAKQLAEQNEQRAIAQAKSDEQIAKRDAAIEKAEIAKLAKETLDGVAGDDETHAYIVKSIRNGGGDAAQVDKALATLRSAKTFAKEAGTAKGVDPGEGPKVDSAAAQLDALVTKYAADHKVTIAKAYVAVTETPEGAALYSKISTPKAGS